jgi:hypothetical protein
MAYGNARKKAGMKWPYRYEIVVLTPKDGGGSNEFSDMCYRKKFIQESDFHSSRARLASDGAASFAATHADGAYLAVLPKHANPGVANQGYTASQTPKKYLNYISGQMTRGRTYR